MASLFKLPSALAAIGALLVCGCATESARLHDVAMKAMAQNSSVAKERTEIAAQPRAATVA